jgi:hypothetical protein
VETGRFGAAEPETEGAGELARYRGHWLFMGARVGPSLRFYTPSGDTPYTGGDARSFSLDAALFAALQIVPRLSVQGEVVFTFDRASSWDYSGPTVQNIDRYAREYTSLSLSFPLTLRWNFYPGRFRLSPFAGFYFLLPLGKMKFSSSLAQTEESLSYKVSPPLGLLGGLSAGLKLGPGMLVADLRYAADLGEPDVRNRNMETYLRSMISFSLGYEWAFFTKKGAPMNKLAFRLVRGALIALLLPLPLFAQVRAEKDPVGVLPLAGEHQEMANRFRKGIIDATAALGKYYPWAVEEAIFQIAGLEIPTDMPPRPDLIPGARYALSGGVYMGIRAREYYLQLWLWDMSGPTMIYTDDLVYGDMEEAMASLPGLVEWLFSHIHERVVEIPRTPLKPDPLITLGLKAGPSQRWYTDPAEISPGANSLTVEGGIAGSLRLNSFLAVQLEVLFAPDILVYRGLNHEGNNIYVMANKKYRSLSLMIPLVFKLNFRPGLFRVSPMAGIYATVPLGQTRYEYSRTGGSVSYPWSFSLPLGFTLGVEGARKYGLGSLLAGIRYSRDFGRVEIETPDSIKYGRDMVSVYLGYEFGFMDRNKK